MAKGNAEIINNFDDLDYTTFQYIMETIFGDRKFHQKQLEFFKYMFELLRHDTDTNFISCASSRCGIGKSTFIQILIRACIYNRNGLRDRPIGIIVVTDSIKRLEDYVDDNHFDNSEQDDGLKRFYINNKENIAVMKSGLTFEEQFKSQLKKPILLMSTQRYFMLGTKVLKSLHTFYHGKKRFLRSKIIFDEPPYFTQIAEINIKTLNDIDTALKDGLDDTVTEKDWITDEYTAFSNRLQRLIKKLESMRNDRINLFWKDNNTDCLTTNDDKFFDLLDKYKDKINRINPDAYFYMLNLKQLQTEGGFFASSKMKAGQYSKNFYIMIDNREKFFLGGDVKSFVLDATCDINPVYDIDYVKQIDCHKFNVPLDMTITNVNMTTSKNALCKATAKSKGIISAISDYMFTKKEEYKTEILIATYSGIVNRFKKDFPMVVYFGNMKGLNSYREYTKMAHIGLNRYSQMVYFFMYCASNRKEYQKVKAMTINESIVYFNEIFSDNEVIDDIMYHSILADFEQNIFRLAIRNLNNREPVYVWAFYNNKDNGNQFFPLSIMMQMRYEPLGVKFIYEDAPTNVKVNSIMYRMPPKGKRMTNAQKIIDWRNKLPHGTEYKIQMLLEETGLTDKQLQKAKSNNGALAKIFDLDKTDKKGYYRVS